ncbi:MAG: DHHA1 domain-containing protein, partial [Clostridia bacterium]|nr:DHHA1 domain-containing protein [Clostridia bacterium]
PGMVEYPELLTRINRVALIDHHRRSEEFIENAELTYHEPYASSACEMVTEILQYINDKQTLSVQEAEALYCGIYLDTKAFTFKTGARTFEAAAYLRKIGVDPIGVHRMFRNDLDMYILKSKVISGAKVYRNNVAIAICEEPSKNIQLVVAQAADELLNINGIEASFVLARVSNRVIISGRSLGAVNVQVILEKLGGGGHITIAGAQLENSSLTIAELKLQNAIDEVMFD